MIALRELVCIFCVIFHLYFGQAQVIQSIAPDDGEKGNCTCGGFPSSTIEENSQPLLSQAPGIGVKCDESGEAICKSLCVALATAAEARGPEILCTRLKEANELKLSAFYKACDRAWLYADMSAHEPLCCENSRVKICSSVESVSHVPEKKID